MGGLLGGTESRLSKSILPFVQTLTLTLTLKIVQVYSFVHANPNPNPNPNDCPSLFFRSCKP